MPFGNNQHKSNGVPKICRCVHLNIYIYLHNNMSGIDNLTKFL